MRDGNSDLNDDGNGGERNGNGAANDKSDGDGDFNDGDDGDGGHSGMMALVLVNT